jgi:hypothetical protein
MASSVFARGLEEMTDDRRNEILNRAISKYGLMNQMNMRIEEMAELIKALSKVRRPNDAAPPAGASITKN